MPTARAKWVGRVRHRQAPLDVFVGRGRGVRPRNPEIAAELFISRKAVEYHLGNVYAKCGLRGRQELRRFVEQWRQPAAV
jgi:regulatory LuxR family protein